MRAMNDRLPSFCTPLDDRWPLPVALPGVQLRSTRFDPALLQPGDFALAGIQPPANILRAVAKRQAEFLAGRLCARAALFALDGRAQTPAVGEDRAPVWPAAISGSITHGDRWAAALVAARGDWRGLGLDVETLLEAERARYLHGEILTEGERLRFADDLERRTGLLVTLAFSLKESLFKALYPLVGKRFYFEHAELLEWRTDGHARLRLLTDLSPEWRHDSELDAQFAVLDERLLSLVAVGA
ncbi:4'-phosphopantetheinyl transferase family protein [Pseudomonas aeruginosa]